MRGSAIMFVSCVGVSAVVGACGSDSGDAGVGTPPEGLPTTDGGDGGVLSKGDGGTLEGGGVMHTCSGAGTTRVTTAPGDSTAPILARGASGASGLVWTDARVTPGDTSVYFTTLDGTAKASAEVVIAKGNEARVAWNGSEWAVMWAVGATLFVQRVSAANALVGAPLQIPLPVTSNFLSDVVVVNGGYAVAISGTIGGPSATADLYFASLSGAGALVGSVVHVTTGLYAEDTPALASSGNGFGLVWKDTRDGDPHIYFVDLDGAGNPKGAEKRISGGTVKAEYPSIVWTGTGYAAAWRQTLTGTDSNQVVKVDPTGNIVAGPVAANPKTGTSHKLEGPALTWNGQLLGVAFPWESPIDGVTFVELDETLTQRSTFATFVPDAVGTGGRYPSLASDADGYTLAWSGQPTYEIFAAHITCK